MPGTFLRPLAEPFFLEGGDSAVLLIHGFTGSPAHMRVVGEALHGAGHTVRGILLPGHGTSLADMEKSTGDQWLAACREAYQQMAGSYRKVSIGGLSLGGVLALLLAEAFDPSAVMLFAPAIRYHKAVNKLSPVVKHFMREMPYKGRKLDPETFLYAYDIGYTAAPVSKVEDMTRLQNAAREGLEKVTAPLVVFQSHHDGSVHPTGPEIITRGANSLVKEICWVDRSPHVLTIGPDRAYVCERTIDFLRRYAL